MHKSLLAALFVFTAPTILFSADAFVKIPAIAGKTPAQVAKILGKPSKEEKTKYGPKFIYKAGKVEVVFIAGKADWITVSGMDSVPYDAKAIESVGLTADTPTFQNEHTIRWQPCGEYYSVSIFPAAGKVAYVYVKVATK